MRSKPTPRPEAQRCCDGHSQTDDRDRYDANPERPTERRDLIRAGVLFGAAGAALALIRPVEATAGKFGEFKPLRPAPDISEGVSPPAPPLAALVLNKAAFGPRPGDIAAFNALASDDPTRLALWVDGQLNPGSDPEVDGRLAALPGSPDPDDQAAFDTVDKTALQLWTQHVRSDDYLIRNRPIWQMERLTLVRGAYSQWQLREVLYDFWINHFNVFGREFPTQGMMPEYDRQIRAHLFGNFGDMLNATSRTASMLYYLDNYANTWPNPNENYAREVLELHTLGAIENYFGAVDPGTVPDNTHGQRAGYTEIDVFQFARALTGWGVSDTTDDSPDTGEFIFRPSRHYNFSQGPIEVLDVTINAPGGGESDVTDVLDYLAGHYGTARFIAWKLCTRLIGDDPPDAIVTSTADEFYARRFDSDQLKEVYRHILVSDEFRSTWGLKVKRPIETLLRAMRGASADLTIRIDNNASNAIFGRLDDTSHYPYGYGPPTGFPDQREMWQGAGPLVMSWRTITHMLRRSDENLPGSGPMLNLAEQTNAVIPVTANRTPQNIVSAWMDRALGYALPAPVSDRMVEFITGIAGIGANSPFPTSGSFDSTNTSSSSNYQRIIRAVVGLVLMAPDAMRR